MISDIRKLVSDGFYREALSLYKQSVSFGIQMTIFDFPILLKACGRLPAISEGQKIHTHVVKSGFLSDLYIATALTDMYMKFRYIKNAHQVFDEMPQRNLPCFNALISGLAWNEHFDGALRVFKQIWIEGFRPNLFTLASVLPVCETLHQGEQIHCYAAKMGFEFDVYVVSAILSMYSKRKELGLAQKIFHLMPIKNVVSFNAMISGFLQNGFFDCVLGLFVEMKISGRKPNSVTLISVLSACSQLSALQFGKQIHCFVLRSELDFDVVTGTSVLDMYCKCKCLKSAHMVFKNMTEKNLVTWNSMISGMLNYGHCDIAVELFEQLESEKLIPDVITWNTMISGFSQQGHAVKAMRFFIDMQSAGLSPNFKSVTSLLPACSSLCDLRHGMEIHGYIIRSNLDGDEFVTTSLVDLYSKCGLSGQARQVFDGFVRKSSDPGLWNAMIAGYGRNGENEAALSVFYKMEEEKMKPNSATFISVLSVCSHTGLVEKGEEIFMKMRCYYGLNPSTEHYACMIDLLSRAGNLREAQDLLGEMVAPSASIFASLLGACSCHLDAELGEEMARRLLELEPKDPSPFVILSNIYAKQGRWGDVERVREQLNEKGLKKLPGYSWIGAGSINA